MIITWRDGLTTLTTATAVLIERAHFHSWEWPLVSNVYWVLTGLVGLLVLSFIFSYILDRYHSAGWSLAAIGIALSGVVTAAIGYYSGNSDYVILLTLVNVLFWMSSMLRHATVERSIYRHPA